MGKIYRFLSVFLLTTCLLTTSFMPSKAFAFLGIDVEAAWDAAKDAAGAIGGAVSDAYYATGDFLYNDVLVPVFGEENTDSFIDKGMAVERSVGNAVVDTYTAIRDDGSTGFCIFDGSCSQRRDTKEIAKASYFGSGAYSNKDKYKGLIEDRRKIQQDRICPSCANLESEILTELRHLLYDEGYCREQCGALSDPECERLCTDENYKKRMKEQIEEDDFILNDCRNQMTWGDAYLINIVNMAGLGLPAAALGVFDPELTEQAGLAFDIAMGTEESTLPFVSHKISRERRGKFYFADTLNDFMGTSHGCWLCPIFNIIFNSVNKLATSLYIQLRSLFLSILVFFGLFWLLWTVFRFITTIHGANVGELMTKLFKGLLTIMFIAILLRASPSFVGELLIDPFATFGTELSSEILKAQGFGSDTFKYTKNKKITYDCGDRIVTNVRGQEEVELKFCERKDKNDAMFYLDPESSDDPVKTILSADVYNSMNCMLRRMSIELMAGLALGSAMTAYGIDEGAVLPKWNIFFCGILVFIIFFVLFVSVPLKMIDILLRLGFVIILLPFFIVCMATPATRGYSKKGWEMFLSCWITLITLFLYLSLAIMLINLAFMRG